MLGEELELPRIQPKGARGPRQHEPTSTPASRPPGPRPCATSSAPTARRCKRQIMSGTYDPRRPLIIPVREDRVYRTWNEVFKPQAAAR